MPETLPSQITIEKTPSYFVTKEVKEILKFYDYQVNLS